jgi:hypothetical protein
MKNSDFSFFKNRLELAFSNFSQSKSCVSKIPTLKNIQNLYLEVLEFGIPVQYVYFSFLPATLIYYNDLKKFQQESSGASDSAAIILTLIIKTNQDKQLLRKQKKIFIRIIN